MRTGLDNRELAVAVRERLRRAGQLLAGPGGVAEMNRQVADNLDKIITALEDEEPDDKGAAAGAP